VLASTPTGAATTAPRGLAPGLPGWLRLPHLGLAQRPLAARLALATVLTGMFAIVAYATSSQSVLVPQGYFAFPPWMSGPLHYVFRYLPVRQRAVDIGFSITVAILLCSWGVLIVAVRQLSLRTIVLAVVGLHLIVVLSPPLQLTDVFNYVGYARLGALHHLSPYTHVIDNEVHDPVFRFSSWHNLHSPYGPLFTALTYPLGLMPLAYAYWIVKVATMLASLGLIALVARCARQLGRDPRFAVVFLALNPIYVVYAMGGFHNDMFMLIAMLGSVSLLLSRRDRSAGAVLMLAVAIKFSAALLLPFLLLGARPARRRREVLVGAVLGALPLAALSLALFGPHIPNLSDQSTLLTPWSIPNLVGLVIGADGGAPWLLKVADLGLVITVVWLLRRRGEWLSSAGWATVALVASLPWLMPWYVIWVLPLAALGTSLRLRRSAVALTVFLVLTFMPVSGWFVNAHNLNPLNTKVGHASYRLQKHLAR
jgi:hypothetical protein